MALNCLPLVARLRDNRGAAAGNNPFGTRWSLAPAMRRISRDVQCRSDRGSGPNRRVESLSEFVSRRNVPKSERRRVVRFFCLHRRRERAIVGRCWCRADGLSGGLNHRERDLFVLRRATAILIADPGLIDLSPRRALVHGYRKSGVDDLDFHAIVRNACRRVGTDFNLP